MKIDEDLSGAKKSTVEMIVQIGGLLIGILALGVTIFFSIRSEHSKEISVTYLSKRPLVTLEPGRTTAGIEVSLGGTRLLTPWLLSGRLENSGDQPIEARDIEENPQFHFSRAKVVSAEIVTKSQSGISAQASILNNDVTITHKLLNPGDWVGFDVLFEGEPELPPSVSLRISGISKAKQNVVSTNVQHSYLSLLPLPKPVIYFMLAIVSGIGAAMILGGFAFLFNFFSTFLKPKRTGNQEDEGDTDLNRLLPKILIPKTFEGHLIYSAISDDIKASDLDDRRRVELSVMSNLPSKVMQELKMSSTEATNLVIAELKEYIKEYIAERGPFWRDDELGPFSSERKSKILAMDMNKVTVEEVARYAKKINDEFRIKLTGGSDSKYESLFGGIIFLTLGISFAMILGGTWLNLLAF